MLVLDIDETVLYARYPDAYDTGADDTRMQGALHTSPSHDALLHVLLPAATAVLFLTGRAGATASSRALAQRHLRLVGMAVDSADIVFTGCAHKGPALVAALGARGLLDKGPAVVVYLEDNGDSVRSVHDALARASPTCTLVPCEYRGGFNAQAPPVPYAVHVGCPPR